MADEFSPTLNKGVSRLVPFVLQSLEPRKIPNMLENSNFSSGKYSDLKIRCGNDVHLVHKIIMCTYSDFFANACDRDFKVRD